VVVVVLVTYDGLVTKAASGVEGRTVIRIGDESVSVVGPTTVSS